MDCAIDRAQVGIILLASGESKRMGANKLLLPLGEQEKPCIQMVAQTLRAMAPAKVVAIYSDMEVKAVLEPYRFEMHYNSRAALGQSEAIKIGISLPWGDEVKGWLFVMGDQPMLNTFVLKTLIDVFLEGDANVVVPSVKGERYSPVLFHRLWKEDFLTLTGDQGGKGLMKMEKARVRLVEFESAEPFMDMDTPEAYAALRSVLK